MLKSLQLQPLKYSMTDKSTESTNSYLIPYSSLYSIRQNNKKFNLIGAYQAPISSNIKYKRTSKLSKTLELQEEIHSSGLETSNRINQDFHTALSNLLKDKYILLNSHEILQYLQLKRELIPVLLEAERQIRKIFIDEKLVLKFIYDPEIVNWKKLIVAIHTYLDASDAFDKLKLLDHSWWLDASYSVSSDLDIHITFDEI